MSDILTEGSIEIQSMDLLMQTQNVEAKYQARLEGLRGMITKIGEDFNKRQREIQLNSERYEPGKVADQLYNLRESVRQSLQELATGRGFLQEIAIARAELEKDAKRNDIEELTQTMKEIEVRTRMAETGIDLTMEFLPYVVDGDPLIIDAIDHAPIPIHIDAEILAEGRKLRNEVLRPLVAKRFHALTDAQNTLESLISMVMPIHTGDIDPIAELASVNE